MSYDIAPTVYQIPAQATRDVDLLRISVLNSQNQVVATTTAAPGPWDGKQVFHQQYFSYTGDGSGDVRLQITSGNAGSGYFAGAIYDIAFWNSEPVPVPEPSQVPAMAVLALGCVGAGVWRHRHPSRRRSHPQTPRFDPPQ